MKLGNQIEDKRLLKIKMSHRFVLGGKSLFINYDISVYRLLFLFFSPP